MHGGQLDAGLPYHFPSNSGHFQCNWGHTMSLFSDHRPEPTVALGVIDDEILNSVNSTPAPTPTLGDITELKVIIEPSREMGGLFGATRV